MILEDILRLYKDSSLRWTSHILERLFQRNIRIDDVKSVLLNGEIIEQYPTDYPFPSCLILGYTRLVREPHASLPSLALFRAKSPTKVLF